MSQLASPASSRPATRRTSSTPSDSRLQGPWSDIYALGGTLYRAVTGTAAEEATLRVDEDRMPPAAQ